MANGKVIIETELDGSGFQQGLGKLMGMADSSGGKGGLMGRVFGGSGGGGGSFGIGNFIKGFAGLKVVQSAWNGVTNSMGGAIDRFDTMNRFPKMMEVMGYSAQDAQDSIDKLNKGVIGLPTTLDTVVGTTQQLALMTGDLGQATDLTLALNNAFLSSGASTSDASRGLTQFTQMLSRGEVDLISWRTLMETMPTALRQVADSFGLPADNAYALYDALKSGDITFEEFTNRVIELSEATGGFADQAQEMTKGVRTAMENMRTAVVRSLEGVMSAFDDGLKSLTGKGIADWINTFSAGISKGFKSAEKGVAGFFNFLNRFKPAFSEIGRVAGNAFQAVGRFFQPVGTMIKEVGASLSVFSEFLTTTIGQISRGDWVGAWDSLTSNISGRFRSLSAAFKTMVADMWTNLNELGANIGNFINNIDWGSVYDSIDGFFGTIGEQIMSVDWKLVGGEIGGSISDLVGGVKNWLDTNVPKVIEYAQTVLFNPTSQLNMDASAFHSEVMDLIDGFIEGLGIKEIIQDFVVEMNAKPMFSWGSWEGAISDALAKMRLDILKVVQAIQNFGNELSQVQVNQDVVMDIMLRRGEGWDESQIKTWIDETYGEGTYDTIIELVPTIEVTEPPVSYSDSIQAWADANATDLTIEQQVAVAIDAHISEGATVGDLQHLIDQQFGEGTYQSTVNAEMLINVLEGAGVDQATIQSFIDGQFGVGTYESTVNVAVNPNLVLQSGHSAGASMVGGVGLIGQIESLVQSMVPKTPVAMSIPIAPQLTTGGAGASAEGESGFDLSGITAQITAELESLKATVSATMETINTTIMTQASAWGTTISTAMTTMVTSVSLTMATMAIAVTLGMTSMSLAVTASLTAMSTSVVASMTALALSVGMAMTAMALSVTMAMTAMTLSVAMAMESMVASVTAAMTAMVEAVTAGMEQAVAAAEAGAEGIVSAVSGLYDSMYSAGQSAGEGLADGLNSMQGAVSAAAAALASVANVAAQAAFIINSPSKVWRSFGYSAGEGLIDGFDGSQRSVERSATRLAMAGLPRVNSDYGLSYATAPTFRKRKSSVVNQPNNDGISQKIDEVISAIQNGQVIALDTGALVGGTASQMDGALGEISQLGGRHRL